MNKILLRAVTALMIASMGCTYQNKHNAQDGKIVKQTSDHMKNLISIVEIPATDFKRAITFYEAVLDRSIEEFNMDGTLMGVLQADEGSVNVALVKGADYQPAANGTIVYLNAEDDLQPMLKKVEENGGKVVTPKTEISPEIGFFALFTDTEGNKLGLYSRH